MRVDALEVQVIWDLSIFKLPVSIEEYRSDKGSYEQDYTVRIFKSVILETSIENYPTVVAKKCPHVRWLAPKIGL